MKMQRLLPIVALVLFVPLVSAQSVGTAADVVQFGGYEVRLGMDQDEVLRRLMPGCKYLGIMPNPEGTPC
jgi:hypothetical protein